MRVRGAEELLVPRRRWMVMMVLEFLMFLQQVQLLQMIDLAVFEAARQEVAFAVDDLLVDMRGGRGGDGGGSLSRLLHGQNTFAVAEQVVVVVVREGSGGDGLGDGLRRRSRRGRRGGRRVGDDVGRRWMRDGRRRGTSAHAWREGGDKKKERFS